jgi:hypothetical protein
VALNTVLTSKHEVLYIHSIGQNIQQRFTGKIHVTPTPNNQAMDHLSTRQKAAAQNKFLSLEVESGPELICALAAFVGKKKANVSSLV